MWAVTATPTITCLTVFDFILRRGNPTNDWRRSPHLNLSAALDAPSLNGITLGSRFDRLSFLGRNDGSQFRTLCYFDLGIAVDHAEDGTFRGYMIVFIDEDNDFRPYRGTTQWKNNQLDIHQLTRNDLASIFGEWYWMDTDDDESIAFYEYPDYEMQIEITLPGVIKRFILTKTPLMADPEQRDAYSVDKPWPPHYGT